MTGPYEMKDLITEKVAAAPTVYHKLQLALADPDTIFEDFAQIIQGDTSLSARLLKIANSSLFGFESQVESITHAMSIIGLEQIIDLAMVSLVIEKFQGIPKELILMDNFWRHSIACGLCARITARHLNEPNVERYYLAGVLHDIGSLVLYQEIPVQARLMITEAQSDRVPLHTVEKKILGFSHTELGGFLLKEWKLPEVLCESIPYVHQPSSAPEFRKLATVIHLADCVAYHLELGQSGEPGKPSIESGSLDYIGVSEDDFVKIQNETLGQYGYAIDTFLS